jgi:hypothetical protein
MLIDARFTGFLTAYRRKRDDGLSTKVRLYIGEVSAGQGRFGAAFRGIEVSPLTRASADVDT